MGAGGDPHRAARRPLARGSVTARAASSGVTEISNFRPPVTASCERFRPSSINRSPSSVLCGDQRTRRSISRMNPLIFLIAGGERADRRALAITVGICRRCSALIRLATLGLAMIASLGFTGRGSVHGTGQIVGQIDDARLCRKRTDAVLNPSGHCGHSYRQSGVTMAQRPHRGMAASVSPTETECSMMPPGTTFPAQKP